MQDPDSVHLAASDAGQDFRCGRASSGAAPGAGSLVEEFYNGTAEKDWPAWATEAVGLLEARRSSSRWPQPLAHRDDSETPEQAWKFWGPLVCNEDGSLNEEHVRNELRDFSTLLHYYSTILCAITGNRISKEMTHPSAVVGVFEDWLTERVEEAVTEEVEARMTADSAAIGDLAGLLGILRSHLGASHQQCDAQGKTLWKRIDRATEFLTELATRRSP